ncbi:MAG: hypothetical protein GEV09_12650 [Pseudonocardiaceae bacterium]|nr:hypothetical protein [Pseudonocardiaceae bacterium]
MTNNITTDPERLDLDNIEQVRAQLVKSVQSFNPNADRFVGLHADSGAERLRSASQISLLASRLAMLEAIELRRPTGH